MPAIDSERDAHLLEVGRAITEWADVQEHLYAIVLQILRCEPRHASIIFFRTPSIEARITLADDLLKTVFPQTSENPGTKSHSGYATWTGIQADLRREMPIRNSLAHHPVDLVVDVWEDKTTSRFVARKVRPATVMGPSEALRKGYRYPLAIEDIKAHSARVSVFASRLLDFRSGPLAAQLLPTSAGS